MLNFTKFHCHLPAGYQINPLAAWIKICFTYVRIFYIRINLVDERKGALTKFNKKVNVGRRQELPHRLEYFSQA